METKTVAKINQVEIQMVSNTKEKLCQLNQFAMP